MNEQKVIAQFEAVRRSGLTNMMNRPRVQQIAFDNAFDDLGEVCEDSRGYGQLLQDYGRLIGTIDEADIPEI